MIEKMYYCGQRDDSGHYVWASDNDDVRVRRDFDFLDNPDRWCGRELGEAKLSHREAMTIWGFREYTIDTRPGSHSTFAAFGLYTSEEMESEARRLFPDVWKRFDFHITATREPDASKEPTT